MIEAAHLARVVDRLADREGGARHVEELVAERVADEAARHGADAHEAGHEARVRDAAGARGVAADAEEHDRAVVLAQEGVRAIGQDRAAHHLPGVVDALRDREAGTRNGDVGEGARDRVVDEAGKGGAGHVLRIAGDEPGSADGAAVRVRPARAHEVGVGAAREDEAARGRRVLERGADDGARVVDAVRDRGHRGRGQQREGPAGIGEAEVVDAVDARVAHDAAGAVQPAHVGHDRAGIVDGVEDVDRGGRGGCERRGDERQAHEQARKHGFHRFPPDG